VPLDYEEAVAELRAEEKRLSEELRQVRLAIPAMVALRNRNRATAPVPVADPSRKRDSAPSDPGSMAGMGPSQAIREYLKGVEIAVTVREIYDALKARGWASEAVRPGTVLSSTLRQLAQAGEVEKVGDGWRLKSFQRTLSPTIFSTNASQRPS